MIVKDYKNNGESIAYTLDYDLFSVNVEHKKTSEGVDVTDLKGLFDWLDEQEVSTAPLESFLSFQNNLLLAGETLDFAMSKRKMTQKEIEELADKLFDNKISERLAFWKEGSKLTKGEQNKHDKLVCTDKPQERQQRGVLLRTSRT